MATSTLHLNNPVPSNGAVVPSLGGRHTVTATLFGVGAISCVVQAWGSEQGTDARRVGNPVTISGTTTVSQTLTFDVDCKQFWLELVRITDACKFNATVENNSTLVSSGPILTSSARAKNMVFDLPRFRRGIADVRSGAKALRLGFDGDSHTAGVGVGSGGGAYNLQNARPYTISALTGKILKDAGINVCTDSWFGGKGLDVTLPQYDSRIVLTGTWTKRQTGGSSLGSGVYGSANVGDTMVIAPDDPWDTCDIYTLQDTGLVGAISIAATGATTQNVNFAGSATYKKTTLTKASPSLGAITLTVTTGFNAFAGINGYACRNSAAPAVECLNIASSGAVWANLNGNTNAYSWYPSRASLALDVVFVDMVHNDLKNGTTMTDWLTGWSTFIAQLKPTTDIVAYVGFPGNFATFQTTMPGWIDALSSLLYANGINIFDWRNIAGSTWGDLNAAGCTNDGDHGNKRWCGLKAAKLAKDLLSICDPW